ncbi:hypothetical protein GIB67_020988 [Kingdonia uniflora]|uniref:Uncharacterized protein n=1 Tax=Kingdonia uniflora TaxID=39325 RepID=A0A7J7M9V9_9MAGN|nr:hypothetical protein GIB67_020988 [Kingdonia uniflora]
MALLGSEGVRKLVSGGCDSTVKVWKLSNGVWDEEGGALQCIRIGLGCGVVTKFGKIYYCECVAGWDCCDLEFEEGWR